jgi:hypothetical protein
VGEDVERWKGVKDFGRSGTTRRGTCASTFRGGSGGAEEAGDEPAGGGAEEEAGEKGGDEGAGSGGARTSDGGGGTEIAGPEEDDGDVVAAAGIEAAAEEGVGEGGEVLAGRQAGGEVGGEVVVDEAVDEAVGAKKEEVAGEEFEPVDLGGEGFVAGAEGLVEEVAAGGEFGLVFGDAAGADSAADFGLVVTELEERVSTKSIHAAVADLSEEGAVVDDPEGGEGGGHVLARRIAGGFLADATVGAADGGLEAVGALAAGERRGSFGEAEEFFGEDGSGESGGDFTGALAADAVGDGDEEAVGREGGAGAGGGGSDGDGQGFGESLTTRRGTCASTFVFCRRSGSGEGDDGEGVFVVLAEAAGVCESGPSDRERRHRSVRRDGVDTGSESRREDDTQAAVGGGGGAADPATVG